jgi:NADH:ubiquinone oxidoreductase subunit 4 (subunit M)
VWKELETVAELRQTHHLAFVRMALGILQMIGAVSSAGLLFHSGVNALSLTFVVMTSLLTAVSVVFFGSRSDRKK